MKKFISMAIAFAMASVMSVSAFAAVSPTATTPTSAKPTTTTTTTTVVTITAPKSTVAATAKNRVKITWNAVKGATKYQVYRAKGKSGSFVSVATTTSTSYVDKLSKSGKYTYKVRALVNGAYEDSKVLSVAMMNFKAKPAAKLSNTYTKKKITVKIKKKIAYASGYQIKYSTAKNMKAAKSKNVSAKKKSVALTNLQPGKRYYIRVRAYQTINGKKYYGRWSTVSTLVVNQWIYK